MVFVFTAAVVLALIVQSSRQAARGGEQRVTFAAVGDSVTAANSRDIDSGDSGDGSWTYYAATGRVRFVGGYALPGATTELMAQSVSRQRADVLVILGGTNDSGEGLPFTSSAASLRTIVDKVGIARVIVSAIPPRDEDPDAASAYNRNLRALAGRLGWTFVDPMVDIRTSQGTYRAGFTTDGVHPTESAARTIGEAMRAAIVDQER